MLDLCVDDNIIRYRFGFGGQNACPYVYSINDNCTGCAGCEEKCLTGIISMKDDKAVINYSNCLECGVCFSICEFNAVDRNY